ncbi:MAG: CHAP domain-containing protein, partial [Planctomycetes bacterium]|nr:CHAP domain-containing protein [Planctomycetota bacterium]
MTGRASAIEGAMTNWSRRRRGIEVCAVFFCIATLACGVVHGQHDILVNGGFEAGSHGWELAGGVHAGESPYSRTGDACLIMGLQNGPRDFATQAVQVPENATKATLEFHYNVVSQERPWAQVFDVFELSIIPTGGARARLFYLDNTWQDPDPGNPYYHGRTFDLTSYRGKAITIELRAGTYDGRAGSRLTWFIIDDLRLLVSPSEPICDYQDDYPFEDAPFCPGGVASASCALETRDPWGFFFRECTSYVAWRLNQAAAALGGNAVPFTNWLWPKVTGDTRNRWSDAHHWDDRAGQLGLWVAVAGPRPGDVAHWDIGEGMGGLGHVAFVEAVHPDGTIDLTEYNRDGTHTFGWRCGVPAGSVPRFIRVLPFLRRPDLVVEAVRFSPASVEVGGTVSVTLSIRNNGPGGAIATKARLRLSEDPRLTRYDWPVAPLDVDVPAISGGRTEELTFPVWISSGTPAGPYYLGAFADADDRAEQTDLTNDGRVSATRLTVTAPGIDRPLITRQPQATEAKQGESVSFSVEATGQEPLSYQWLHAGLPIGGATGPSHFITSASQVQAGVYQVRVSNAGGITESASVSLFVK